MQIGDDLIRSCIAQNRHAQRQFYDLLLPYLRAVASRYLRDTSYIKDVLQESFVKVFRSLESYNYSKGGLKTWAAKITINTCFNYNTRTIGAASEEIVVEVHPSVRSPVAESWTKEDLLGILKQMPDGYFEVFNLYVIDGYSHEEIAVMLNISEPLSRKRLSRARGWVNTTFPQGAKSLTKVNPSVRFLNKGA